MRRRLLSDAMKDKGGVGRSARCGAMLRIRRFFGASSFRLDSTLCLSRHLSCRSSVLQPARRIASRYIGRSCPHFLPRRLPVTWLTRRSVCHLPCESHAHLEQSLTIEDRGLSGYKLQVGWWGSEKRGKAATR